MITPPRLKLARLPTPLLPLDRLSEHLGGPRIWLKRDDLTDTTASGNKLRKLEFSLAQALEEKANVIITCGGVQSNHCRATAVMASAMGLKCHLLLRGRPPEAAPDGNLLLDTLVGAEITYLTLDDWHDLDAVFDRTASMYRDKGDTPFCIPTGASDEIGLWGYIEAARELKQDFADQDMTPGFLVSATGSGGTLGGLIVGRQVHGLDTTIVSFNVSDTAAWFEQKIAADMARWQTRYDHRLDPENLAINVIDGYVGPGYGRADPPVFETIRTVARLEGVIFDPVYTGKAFDGMIKEMKGGRLDGADNIVFLHTGGLFGLFPQREYL